MGDIAVDYISTGYLDKHLGKSMDQYDARIVMGMVTGHLVIHDDGIPLLQLRSTVLFRQLQHLDLTGIWNVKILILPYLEQIKRLEIQDGGYFPEYSLNIDFPLTHTVEYLSLNSVYSWMLGRTFKALREVRIGLLSFAIKNLARYEGLQVDLPACTILHFRGRPIDWLRFLSCSNLLNFHCWQGFSFGFGLTASNLLRDFLSTLSCLQNIYIFVIQGLGTDPLIDFVFYGALEKGIWRDIRSVEMKVEFDSSSEASDFIEKTVRQQRYGKWWKTFITERRDGTMVGKMNRVIFTASM